jgi:putative photosynthetic complex assembly protein
MSAAAPRSFPRYPLFGAAGLVAFSLLAAGFGRWQHERPRVPESAVAATRALRFADRPDGAVVITEIGAAQPLEVLTGQNGFLRSTMRGLARTRAQDGIGADVPFRLTAWTDGRLTIDDPATGRHVELEAFGGTNEAVFARLLEPRARP